MPRKKRSPENMVKQNSLIPQCVDGRKSYCFIERNEVGQWVVVKRSTEAEKEIGPQFLGASLLFVKALQEVAYIKLDKAFELVEEASRKLGFGLQIHLDDDHGKANLVGKTDEEIVAWFEDHQTGCGFARYAWGDDKFDEIIKKAKSRGWRVQVLIGAHEEGGAIINHVKGKTFHTAAGVNQEKPKFNTDLAEAEEMFEVLGEMLAELKNPVAGIEFAKKAMGWNIETYKKVVHLLKGIPEEEIEINE